MDRETEMKEYRPYSLIIGPGKMKENCPFPGFAKVAIFLATFAC